MWGIVAECDTRGRARSDSAGRLVRGLVAFGLAFTMSGCYVMQAATGQLGIMAKSRPIDSVIADPATTEATRSQLELAVEARAFAVSELALPDGRSYTKYADIGREYVLWNVVATPEFSLRPLRWCFPVAGCVSYRGYFHQADANAFAWRLVARGDDAVVEGVAAYSTLGHLPDPLPSTMIGWRATRLVGTIFHELAHERLYVAGDSGFNEAFASVVEDAGVRRWLTSRGEQRQLTAYEASRGRHAGFVALLAGARARLAQLYASGKPPAVMRVEKNRIFGRLKYDYQGLRQQWGGYPGYDDWFARPLDNASLASVATYRDCVPGLERELAAAGSMPAFYARAEQLAKLPFADRRATVCEGK
ncbi:MAG: aminopeptidase [Steroidobacteraceae bacterium]|nr:aminopeptidase [Steroidobacteraceae bacterium]